MKNIIYMVALVFVFSGATGLVFGKQRAELSTNADWAETVMEESIYNGSMIFTDWVEYPETMEALYEQSDIVVRAEIGMQENYVHSETLAIYGLSEDISSEDMPIDELLIQEGMKHLGIDATRRNRLTAEEMETILDTYTLPMVEVAESIDYQPYTLSGLNILELFKGDREVASSLQVTQWGGEMPRILPGGGYSDEETGTMSFPDNPLLVLNKEYILFLDQFQTADGETRYGLVGPTGQFLIEGDRAYNPIRDEMGLSLPNTADVLQSDLLILSGEPTGISTNFVTVGGDKLQLTSIVILILGSTLLVSNAFLRKR